MQANPISMLKALEKELDIQAENLPTDDGSYAAEALKPKTSAAYLQLAKSMADLGCAEESVAICRKAVRITPDNLDAHYFILSKLEKLNRVDEAWSALRALEKKGESPCDAGKKLYFLKACLEYRRGHLEIARAMLERFIEENPLHSHWTLACGWLGKTLDRLGQYGSAMEAFDRYNRTVSATPIARITLQKSNEALAKLETSLRWYGNKTSFGWRDEMISDGLAPPVLLVGFPRSGTTLFEQILNSHTALTTLEEKPTLQGIVEMFYGSEGKLRSLGLLGDDKISFCRQTYRSNVAGFLGRPVDAIMSVVDKLPLNIMHLDIYSRLFPEMKILVALRDPRDVVLSNYMQMYKLNPEMAINLSLVDCARYYSKVMALYLLFRQFIPDNIHEIRYEDTIRDFKGESTKLLEFLGLEWEDGLERYYENAKTRRINTPSYDQVIKPIYSDAVGRWKNYASHLQELMPILQPFIDAFGYSTVLDRADMQT